MRRATSEPVGTRAGATCPITEPPLLQRGRGVHIDPWMSKYRLLISCRVFSLASAAVVGCDRLADLIYACCVQMYQQKAVQHIIVTAAKTAFMCG